MRIQIFLYTPNILQTNYNCNKFIFIFLVFEINLKLLSQLLKFYKSRRLERTIIMELNTVYCKVTFIINEQIVYII